MSLASGLMCGGGRFTCLGEVPTGATVREVQERAAYAARMAEHYRRLQNTAAARVWSNAAERLRKELLARAAGLEGVDPMDAFDLFDVEDVPAATPGDLFRNSRKGYEFIAGGRRWRVTRDDVGLNQRLVIEAEKRDDEGSSFAEWKDGVLTISPLAKRGAFRPVGRPLVKEQLKGLGGLQPAFKRRSDGHVIITPYYHDPMLLAESVGEDWDIADEEMPWLDKWIDGFADESTGEFFTRVQAARHIRYEPAMKRRGLIAEDFHEPDFPKLAALPSRGPIPAKQVARVMKKLQAKVKACGVSKTALREGMAVEREHRDVTKLGVEKTARIALAHLCERKDYYKRLKKYVER